MPYPYNIPGFPGAPVVPMSLSHQYLSAAAGGAPAGAVTTPMDQLQRLALNGPHSATSQPPLLQDKVSLKLNRLRQSSPFTCSCLAISQLTDQVQKPALELPPTGCLSNINLSVEA